MMEDDSTPSTSINNRLSTDTASPKMKAVLITHFAKEYGSLESPQEDETAHTRQGRRIDNSAAVVASSILQLKHNVPLPVLNEKQLHSNQQKEQTESQSSRTTSSQQQQDDSESEISVVTTNLMRKWSEKMKTTYHMTASRTRKSVGRDFLLVKVLACSLSPRDCLATTGLKCPLHIRPSELPYIPGTDIVGQVVDTTLSESHPNPPFQIGDVVVGNTGRVPVGGLAEYAILPLTRCARKPSNVKLSDASACHSAGVALVASHYVRANSRVLILNGSGGVGTSLIQLVKKVRGASFVAVTSTRKELCKSLGADRVINYMEEEWWNISEFQRDNFHVIIDCIGGVTVDEGLKRAEKVLHSGYTGGWYVAVASAVDFLSHDHEDNAGVQQPADETIRPVHVPSSTIWSTVRNVTQTHVLAPIGRAYTPRLPRYVKAQSTRKGEELRQVLQLVEDGTLNIVLHPSAPFPFTEMGVKDALRTVASGHAHGKVVVGVDECINL